MKVKMYETTSQTDHLFAGLIQDSLMNREMLQVRGSGDGDDDTTNPGGDDPDDGWN